MKEGQANVVMMGKLTIILILNVCIYCGRCENDTMSSNITDYDDYGFESGSDEMPVNVSIYPSIVQPLEPSTEFLVTTGIGTEEVADGPTTPLILIKPVVTRGTPKPGVSVLTYEDNSTSTLKPVVEILEITTEYDNYTEIPEVTSQAPNDMNDTISLSVQSKIEGITQKLGRIDSVKDDEDIHKLIREVAAEMEALKDELDLVIKDKEGLSKKLFDHQSRYIQLQQKLGEMNDTRALLRQKDLNRVDTVLSLLNQTKITEAAKEVSTLTDMDKIHDIVYEFYQCNQENIMYLIQFTYQLIDHTLDYVNRQESTRQLISLLALYSEMNSCNQTSDPGILAIKDVVVSIHSLEEFSVIKQDAKVLYYDAFREEVEKDARKVLDEWQNKMLRSEFQDIVEFALRSPEYSDVVNNNMISLVWVPTSFEANIAFFNALPDSSNRVAGYVCLADVYKNHNRSEEMIKLAVTARIDFEKNTEDFDEYYIDLVRHKFWTSIRKLVWSESCVVKNLYTKKYLFEFMEVGDRNKATYSVETVSWKGYSLETNKDFRWKFVPNASAPGKFEIQNVEYQHYLIAEGTNDGSFKYWPRTMVKTTEDRNRTSQWTIILADRDAELFSFKSDSGVLTGGKTPHVYAEDRPQIANISKKDDKTEFLQHHLWDLECS